MSTLSRRSFIRTAALGAAGVGAAGLMAGCSSASGAGNEVSFDEEFDVVVVGAGLAGVAAAITVGRDGEGAKCLLAEKGTVPSGNSPACDQAALFVKAADKDKLFTYLKDCSGELGPSEDIIRVYADEFSKNLEWVKTFGVPEDRLKITPLPGALVEYPEYGSDQGILNIVQVLDPENTKSVKYMLPTLLQEIEEKLSDTVTYRTSAGAESLIQDPESKAILGVVIAGKKIKANKGVILACGGFENSPEYLQCFVQVGSAKPAAAMLNTGDGIKMCLEVGAHLWHMSGWAGSWMHPRKLDNSVFLVPGVGLARQKMKSFGITVGMNGRRFYMDFDGHNVKDNQDDGKYPTMGQHVGSRHGIMQFGGEWSHIPMPSKGWFIFDAEGLKAGAMGPDFTDDPVKSGWCYSAQTIKELAGLTKVPEDELVSTVEQWNRYCAQGKDEAFYRPASTLHPITQPPYYAMMCTPSFLNTDGGAERNAKFQVMGANGQPIKGLYSAGEFGSFWGHHYQGGGNVGECLLSGRVAAKNALES